MGIGTATEEIFTKHTPMIPVNWCLDDFSCMHRVLDTAQVVWCLEFGHCIHGALGR